MTEDTASSEGRPWSYGGIVFSGLFVLAAAMAFVGVRGLPLLLALGAVLGAPLMRGNRAARPALLILVAFVGFANFSLTWSPEWELFDPADLERFTAFKLAVEVIAYFGLVLAALRLKSAPAERAALFLAFGMVGLAALLIVDGLMGAAIYEWLNRLIGDTIRPDLARRNVAQAAYVLAVLAWPAGMTLRRAGTGFLVILLAAGVVAAMLALGADAPAAALVAGAAAFGAVSVLGRTGVIAVGWAWALYWLAAPWLVLGAEAAGLVERAKGALPASWDARLDIWTFAAHRIAEKPFLGWGLDASRHFEIIPLHTHSAPIQHWLELGLVGAVLAAALWGAVTRTILRGFERGYAATAMATLSAFLAISCLSFSAWEEWWLASGVLGLLACIVLKRFWSIDPVFGGHTSAP